MEPKFVCACVRSSVSCAKSLPGRRIAGYFLFFPPSATILAQADVFARADWPAALRSGTPGQRSPWSAKCLSMRRCQHFHRMPPPRRCVANLVPMSDARSMRGFSSLPAALGLVGMQERHCPSPAAQHGRGRSSRFLHSLRTSFSGGVKIPVVALRLKQSDQQLAGGEHLFAIERQALCHHSSH